MAVFQKCMISLHSIAYSNPQFIPHTYPPSSLQSLFHGMHILRMQQSFYEIKQSSRVRSAYTDVKVIDRFQNSYTIL